MFSVNMSVSSNKFGDFKSVMTYVPEVEPENLVSLTMPVRTESYPWDDELHPIFRMNLPEGYLLQVLQEEFQATHRRESCLPSFPSSGEIWWEG